MNKKPPPRRTGSGNMTKQGNTQGNRGYLILALGFLLGSILSTVVMLNIKFGSCGVTYYNNDDCNDNYYESYRGDVNKKSLSLKPKKNHPLDNFKRRNAKQDEEETTTTTAQKFMQDESTRNSTKKETTTMAIRQDGSGSDGGGDGGYNYLNGLKVLVAIAAFDFSQIPHLEEVLDGYHDICVAGAEEVHIVIHTVVPYPVTLIDLWNTRYFLNSYDNNHKYHSNHKNFCKKFQISVVVKSRSLRLHLVDCHRTLFYEKINEYDLFIYTEDDMRVSPRLISTYMKETKTVENIINEKDPEHKKFKPSDFNVGVVRYEYNFPSNVIIDDKTRHATQNVTRVYWEHSSFKGDLIPNAVDLVPQEKGLPFPDHRYIYMKNHHQGMYLATRQLLLDWKIRKNCQFDVIRDRPGRGSQPTEGTQRVWMSSHMLYGGRHCGVQQILPMDNFNLLTLWHLPNKNYRRVGKYRSREFSDGTEKFHVPPKLLTAMEVHLAIRRQWPQEPQEEKNYNGIQMIDEVTHQRNEFLERRMKEYREYVQRGGVLSEEDMTKTALGEE